MDVHSSIVAIVVPLSAFALAAFILGAVLVTQHRQRKLRHETIRLALEKGLPVPQELLREDQPRTRNDLSTGVKLLSFGVGLALFLRLTDRHSWAVGLIFVMLGVGFVAAHALTTGRGRAAPPAP